MEFDTTQLASLFRRWWWLVLIGPLIGGLINTAFTSREVPEYTSTVVLQVNPPQLGEPIESNALQATVALATTYYQLIWTRPVLEPVISSLSLPYTVEELKQRVDSQAVRGTPLISVKVTDSDPERASEIAAAIANSFTSYITTHTVSLSDPARATIDEQLVTTSEEISQIELQIQTIQQSPSAQDVASQEQVSQLQTTLVQLQQNYADLLGKKQTMDLNVVAAQTQVSIAVPAEPGKGSQGASSQLSLVIGAFFGLMVACASVLAIGYLDHSVKAITDFPSLVGAPLLSRINNERRVRSGMDQLFMLKRPHGRAAEAIRLLRTNVEFAVSEQGIRSVAVCSPATGEGKSTVVANLAVATARAGVRTVLIDADLRRPSQHRIFDLSNLTGVTSWLKDTSKPWESIAQNGPVAGLRIIPAGPIPENYADLMSLGRLDVMLQNIGESVDLVLVDTSPVLNSSDGMLVAAEVDGVVIVCQAGKTNIDALRQTSASFQPFDANVLGVVLNRQSRRNVGIGSYLPPSTGDAVLLRPVRRRRQVAPGAPAVSPVN